jgi:hypothetical protein
MKYVCPLTVHRGVGALPLDDEAQRRLRVPVCGRDLAALDELDRAGERVGGAMLERRIVEDQYAAVRLGGGDDIGRFQNVGPHVALIAPIHRRDLRRRFRLHELLAHRP